MDSSLPAPKAMHRHFSKIFRYLLAGSSLTVLVIALFWFLSSPLDINYVVANIIATTTGIIIGFFVHTHYTHMDKKGTHEGHGNRTQFVKFVGLSLANIGLSAVLMIVLVSGFVFPEVPAQALTSLLIAAWTYTAQLFFVYA
jgi:putative flippase GtrA